MKRIFVFILIAFLSTNCQTKKSFFVANWNVENLFDTVDDPDKRDEDFTPEGRYKWTEAKLDKKLSDLSQIINSMNNEKGPDILGFEEVEHQSLIDSLIKRHLSEKNYGVVYQETLDKRGIDNGLIYKKDIFDFGGKNYFEVILPDKYPTRYVLVVKLKEKKSEEYFYIIVNHWPSRRGGEEKSEPNRIAAAETVLKAIDSLRLNPANDNIIILGDFNDEPINKAIKDVLGAKGEIGVNSKFYNTAYAQDMENRGSYNYRGQWNMLDQIIVSKALVDNKGFDYKPNSFQVIKDKRMIVQKGKYKGYPYRTLAGKRYLGGYSDHFPVSAIIELK